jgi:hypothetical protein
MRPVVCGLPPRYHSAAQIQLNLPNINTLILKAPSSALLQALATQLTSLEIRHAWIGQAAESIRHCCNLQHLHINNVKMLAGSAGSRPLPLTVYACSDNHIKTLLQLPRLVSLRLPGINIEQNWSGHACSWQELHLTQQAELEFTSLANLCWSSLKKLSMRSDVVS